MMSQQELQQKIQEGWNAFGLFCGILFLIAVVQQCVRAAEQPWWIAVPVGAIGLVAILAIYGVGMAMIRSIRRI